MQYALMIAIVLHVLGVVFWAGSTFTLTRLGGEHAEQLFRPQMGAAGLAIVTGAVLWGLLHQGAFGLAEQILAVGAFAALAAAGVQGALIGSARRKLAATTNDLTLRGRMALANRIAAGLLAVALVAMTAVRYV